MNGNRALVWLVGSGGSRTIMAHDHFFVWQLQVAKSKLPATTEQVAFTSCYRPLTSSCHSSTDELRRAVRVQFLQIAAGRPRMLESSTSAGSHHSTTADVVVVVVALV